jgi:Xaa-Pro aminopeptidase
MARKMYEVVLKANQEGIKHIKANVHGVKIDAICRDLIKKQ